MATISRDRQSAAITIPADYLEDARSALAVEVHEDSDRLRAEQADVASGKRPNEDLARSDLASAMSTLRKDVRLLDELLDVSGDANVTAGSDTLAEMLEATVRVLSGRLAEEMRYGPLNMGAMRELADRLRWAADETNRIWPALGPTEATS